MELQELHVDEFRPRVIGHRMAVPRVLPGIRGHLERLADAAVQSDELHKKSLAALAPAQKARDPIFAELGKTTVVDFKLAAEASAVVAECCPSDYPEEWDLPRLITELTQYYPTKFVAEDFGEAVTAGQVTESVVRADRSSIATTDVEAPLSCGDSWFRPVDIQLGPDGAAYTDAALAAAMAEHRYDVQAALYLLALHRLLKSRLPDYDYDCHIGGAIYVFMRGIDTDSGGIHRDRPPRALIEALDRLFRGEAPA